MINKGNLIYSLALSVLAFALLLWGWLGIVDAQGPTNPAVEALAWGADFFPYPDWDINLSASGEFIAVMWNKQDSQSPALVRYERQLIPYSGDLAAIVNDEWMDIFMVDYESWRDLGRCQIGNHYIVELSAQHEGLNYIGRYWVWVDEISFYNIFAIYTEDRAVELEVLAEVFFSAAPTCKP